MGPGKRTMELDEVSNWLEEKNRKLTARRKMLKQIDKLHVEVAAMKAGEDRWTMAYEKCRDLESEKGEVEMDLKAAMAENKSLRRTLKAKDARITTLVTENEHVVQEQRKQEEGFKASKERTHQIMCKARDQIIDLKRVNTEKEAEFIHLKEEISRQKEQMSDEKMATKANEKKITELVQRIKVLEAEKMTVKEEGDKKILELAHKFDVLDKEKQTLDEELMQRIDVTRF